MPHTTTAPSLYYETSGDAGGEPVVLIAGSAAQLIWWRDGFVQALVDRGLFVIRFDNRDTGLSDRMGGPGDLGPCYTLDDLGADVCRVLDALELRSAHVIGQSLGGGIAQAMALNAPDRVRSLTLFYTMPHLAAEFLTETLLASAALPDPDASLTRDAAIAYLDAQGRATASTLYPFDEAWNHAQSCRHYDRGWCPEGVIRQSAVMLGWVDRGDALSALAIPAAIIHGRADHAIRPEGGIALARTIPDSELHLYPGMGHEIPQALWDEFATIIARTVARAA